MKQLNIHITSTLARDLLKFMKMRHIKTKAEAVRTSIKEGLEHSSANIPTSDFSKWIGLGNQVPLNKNPKFKTDDDLWK